MKKQKFLIFITFMMFVMFPCGVYADEINTIEISGFNEPVVGESPIFNAITDENANYYVHLEAWEGNNSTMIESVDNSSIINKIDKFEQNVVYTYLIYIKPKNGYQFADDVTAKIDGIDFDDYRMAGSTLIFEYQYGTPKEAPVKVENFKVIFDANEGSFKNDKKIITIDVWDNKYADTLETPVRDGYTFKGYYTEKIGGQKFEMILNESGIDSDMIFYAHWEKVSSVSESEQEVKNPKTYDGIGNSIIILMTSLVVIIGTTIYLKKETM